MSEIKLLDKQTASKIAAGEVIERPAGVLKELIENSLDAGADIVNIDIEKAGKTLIRVSDNGKGIEEEDLPKTILRHTTSKINDFEDLNNLNTFGFRGEALFSVAAISKVSITSCRRGQSGAKISAEAGKITARTKAPSIAGTAVEARDLFFNTPARLKFLKSDSVERAHLLQAAEEAALANPEVAFNVKVDGVKVYNLPPQQNTEEGLRKRTAKILGEDLAQTLLYIEDETYGLRAFVSPADKLIAARDSQFFFINRRPVGAKILQQAVYKAYQPYRAKDKHPAVILFMQLPPVDFDVNIHPQKKEIKFMEESAVYNFICKKISAAVLRQSPAEQLAGAAAPQPVAAPVITPDILSGVLNKNIENRNNNLFQARDFEEPPKYSSRAQEETTSAFTPLARQEKQEGAPAWWQPPYNYLGQMHNSYLIFENPNGLVLVDQHAAQERVFFEEYLNSLENASTQKQPLMFPVSVDMAASDIEALLAWQEVLDKAGFEISRFSPRTILINTVPNILKFKEDTLRDFIISLANVIGAPSKSGESLKYKLIAAMACKKSIKAGQPLESAQAGALMQNLKTCLDGLHCPHGRPTIIEIGIKEVNKKFQRG